MVSTRTKKSVLSSVETLEPDEWMSEFYLQTRKIGNIPNISHLFRNPEPVGSEFKSVWDVNTSVMLNAELQ